MVVYAHNGFLWFTIMAQDEVYTFSLRLPEKLADSIKELALRERRSKNGMVVIIIERYLEDQLRNNNKVGLPPPHLET